MKNGQKKLTIKTIVNYCPQCAKKLPKSLKRPTNSVLVVDMKCSKHQPKFVKTGTGIMVPESFLRKFKEMIRPVSLSSQEI